MRSVKIDLRPKKISDPTTRSKINLDLTTKEEKKIENCL